MDSPGLHDVTSDSSSEPETSSQSSTITVDSSTSVSEDSTGNRRLRNCVRPIHKNGSECCVKRLLRQNAKNYSVIIPPELGIVSIKPSNAHREDPDTAPRMEKLIRRFSQIQDDGTVQLNLDADTAAELPGLFGINDSKDNSLRRGRNENYTVKPLSIVMLIVGTRGDVQPFLAIGKRLQKYGHRVRLATHEIFEEFVSEAGLEFYPLGGDPKILADYMVKNKGLLPSSMSDVYLQQKQLKDIMESLLHACTLPGNTAVPFKAQAIIANPPAYGHVDVAEHLKVPLHIFFTMPWTPTNEFAHPLSRVVGQFNANWLSYKMIDMFIWIGIGSLINQFRTEKLNLPAIYGLSGSLSTLSELPTSYIWSPHLVPKPKDWGSNIDVVGFCFLNLTQDYKPSRKLTEWLAAGPPPVYVGFGSMPVDNAEKVEKIILDALRRTSQRGIINRGWGGIGTNMQQSDSIYLIDDCPHDWLFPRCSAVIHHGGAGTTAAGIRAARPTTVIPFFGDQFFWGNQIQARGVGPPPIPIQNFAVDALVSAINYMMLPAVKLKAAELAAAINVEDGVEVAVAAFHKHLPITPE